MEQNIDYSLSHQAKQSNLRRNKGNRAFARSRWKPLRKLEFNFKEWLDNQEIHARRTRKAREVMAEVNSR